MKLDATFLFDKSHIPALPTVIVWRADSWPTTLNDIGGPFTGYLTIEVDKRDVRIDAKSIAQLRVDAVGVTIFLAVPSPVPKYLQQSRLFFQLIWKAGAWTFEQNEKLSWFRLADDKRSAPVNAWLAQANINFRALQTNHAGKDSFPLDQLGVTSQINWGRCPPFGNLGFILSEETPSLATIVFIPFGDSGPGYAEVSEGIPLYGLDKSPFGANTDFVLAPAVLAYPLSSEGHQTFGYRAGWRTLVQREPLKPKDPKWATRFSAQQLLDACWNNAVRVTLRGHHVVTAAQPWLALPLLKLREQEKTISPQLLFDNTVPGEPRLQKILLPTTEATPITATFIWQADSVAGQSFGQAASLKGNGIVLEAELTPQAGGQSGWRETPSPKMASQLLDVALIETADPSVFADWVFDIKSAKSDAPKSWITIGSLEFQLSEPQVFRKLECRLRGNWTPTLCDVYPEVRLQLDCLVRVSTAADAAGRNLETEFDATNHREEALQRDSEPLRIALAGTDEGRKCSLTIRHKSEPGRNSVAEMSVRSTDRKPLGGEALYFQARPFVVAKVRPAEIDDQAGELIAIWRSDDSEGAQWRVPDTTLEFDFPPQAVGEEMERGDRFWPKGAPYINPTMPIRYRFSPPTRMVVRPSGKARRYNKGPSNLCEALDGATVESFLTEVVYPVQTEFKVSDLSEPDVRIAETAAFIGHTAVNLPGLPQRRDDYARPAWMATVVADELADWAMPGNYGATAPIAWDAFASEYDLLRNAHRAVKATFSARLAQFHLYDPWRKDGGLRLREGLKFRIRGSSRGAPPLMNPLPQKGGAVELLETQQKTIGVDFLKTAGGGGFQWGSETDGALRAGVVHTIEFPSELISILRHPESDTGSIDALAFTALGATGKLSTAFDEGRTTFIAETQHGQVSRLVKVRIGRIALLWNRAKHVIVYERTTVPSTQFKLEQEPNNKSLSRGWPILRKTEEYVEPIDAVRAFDTESQRSENRSGFMEAAEFVSKRIYVNGAWGKDLEHGYEIPLWNRADTTGFYPKPQLALRMQAGGESRTRCWLDAPEHLYFYSNTVEGTGDEPDRWPPKTGVDCPAILARMPVMTRRGASPSAIMDSRALPAPRLGGAGRPRFDLATVSDGTINLQHGRGETEMLVALNVVSLARTDEASAPLPDGTAKTLTALADRAGVAADLAAVEDRVRHLLERLPHTMLEAGLDCKSLKERLKKDVDDTFKDVKDKLQQVRVPPEVTADCVASMIDDFLAGINLGDRRKALITPVRLTVEQLRQDALAIRAAADVQIASAADIAGFRTLAKRRIKELTDRCVTVLANIKSMLTTREAQLSWKLKDAQNKLSDLSKLVAALDTNGTVPEIAAKLKEIGEGAAAIRPQFDSQRRAPGLGPIAAKIADALSQIENGVAGAGDWVAGYADALKSRLKELIDAAFAALTSAEDIFRQMTEAATRARVQVENIEKRWIDDVSKLTAALDIATDISKLNAALDNWVVFTNKSLDDSASALIKILEKQLDDVQKSIDAAAGALKSSVAGGTAPLVVLVGSLSALGLELKETADQWLEKVRVDVEASITALDCAAIDDARKKLEATLAQVESDLRNRITGSLNSLIDESTRTKMEELAADAASLGAKVGKGMKLVKAIGDLPALPTLSFNAERAEYVFDDFKKQIETSPFAARLREIDSGLKELGLTVPTSQLLDQIVPDKLKDVDFNKVFKNLGGIDFQDFFRRFKLPDLSSDKIKITHGLDKATRSAWVKTTVNADFSAEQSLFEFASVAVRISNIALRAQNDVQISADGARRSVTDGRFTGDWGVDFGGTRMATFRDVTVRFDGGGFDFDISPEKVQLHPSLKFIQEYAKQFEDKLPPAVQLEKDARGVPVGVRASFATIVDNLPPIPPVTIGPILIASGLGLRMNKEGIFEISTHLSVGSMKAPIFVQISYLGGGMWLEAQCVAKGSRVVSKASLGLAVGSMRAINLASVARGSYAVLLFAYAEISESGGSLRAGMSMVGSARILGIANASISLVLEVEHRSGGGTTARGTLDVEVDICWCYSIHVQRAAEHKL